MKITVIAMIKNSADVIESFIRGNGLFADNYMIINNGSTDRSIEILECLSREGYKIDIFNDDQNAYLQSMKMNILIDRTKSMYNPDWIVPLDDDEILFSPIAGKSVREIFESFDDTKLHYARWKNYIPSENASEEELCVMKRQSICFDASHETWHKVILSRKNLEGNTLIEQGNHEVINCDADKIYLDELMIAHYPVRSEAQILSKALVGWTNILAMPNSKDNDGWHWKLMYKKIKEGGSLSVEDMWSICMLYIKDSTTKKLSVEHSPMSIDESAFIMKYTTKDEIDPWLNYMNNVEQIAKNYKKLQEKES